ncbi:PaaI family thioesterase [Paracoccus spongiarum]|uniref:PaaI family thioesterase n=1 Tax=Paracoccus spongiarum TaxID=3064387 RepID=A0ABT9JFA2_9RHOB|nr:PaaI family thioesterase [Paracoccus sp. 2205BS29-5]MDP5308496.1 PaaI family thioesterase [Paracoccus sp. 2205BS29-5]
MAGAAIGGQMRDQDGSARRIDEIGSAFARHLGARVVLAGPDEVIFEMVVTQALANNNNVLHGGAIMGLADNAGGTGTLLNIPRARATTTIESKTNFLRPIRVGDVARATATPLHRGRTTQVWQSVVTRGDGKVAAIVTQTQMVMEWQE